MESKKDEKEELVTNSTETSSENKKRNTAASQAQQEKLKKQVKQSNHEEDIRNTDPKELRKKLSNKNSDYIFRVEKYLLDNENFAMDQVEPAIDEILPDIIIAQHKGIPASTLYQKSPTQKAKEIAHPEAKPVKQKFSLQALDNILLYLALFAGLYGIVQLFSGKQAQKSELGVVTLFALVIGLGYMMAYYNRWMVTPKSERMATWKIIGWGIAIIVLMFLWVTLTSLPAFRLINPPLNPWAEIVIAIIAFGARYYLKRKYHIIDPVKQMRIEQAKKRD